MSTAELAIVFATFLGPIFAVLASDARRERQERSQRKRSIFTTMMATRSQPAHPSHVEAINLIELVFNSGNRKDQAVIEAWKMYRKHLDIDASAANWEKDRLERHYDLLVAMSAAAGFKFQRSDIVGGTYYPKWHAELESDQALVRKLAIGVLDGTKPLKVIVQERALPVASAAQPVELRSQPLTAIEKWMKK